MMHLSMLAAMNDNIYEASLWSMHICQDKEMIKYVM